MSDTNGTHTHTLARVTMPEEQTLRDLAEFYRVFGDPTRLRMLHALMCGEMCVHELSALVGLEQSAVSHQLRILRNAHLVRYRKEGKEVYYSLSDDHVRTVVEQGLGHVSEG